MIKLKTKKEIEYLREGGIILGTILDTLSAMVEPGINTKVLEEKALAMIQEVGGSPAFKGYKVSPKSKGFPSALCASVNDDIVHGAATPGKFLKQGDIIGLDIGMKYKGLFTDTAVTVPVGKISQDLQKLLFVTKECLELGIKQAKAGNTLRDITRAVQINAESNGFGVVRELVGHGVGHAVHEEPQVPNFDSGEKDVMGIVLKPGMVIAIEPMLTTGDWRIKTGQDGFALATIDGSMAAHFEHTVAIMEEGNIIITSPED